MLSTHLFQFLFQALQSGGKRPLDGVMCIQVEFAGPFIHEELFDVLPENSYHTLLHRQPFVMMM